MVLEEPASVWLFLTSNTMQNTARDELMGYLYILGTIFFTVYGQIVLKWRVGQAGVMPDELVAKLGYVFRMLADPWVIGGLFGAFLAFICWMGAVSKFDLSYAYPFTSLSFLLVLIFSAILFREPITVSKIISLGLIISGLILGSRT
jgi:multidrug transporter EmrE-like cation transporter